MRLRTNPHFGRVRSKKSIQGKSQSQEKTDCSSMIGLFGLTKATQFIDLFREASEVLIINTRAGSIIKA
jgi:hypothetical protein